MKTLTIQVWDGGGRKATMVFTAFPVRIGRADTADCYLDYPYVSRVHARIDLRGGRLYLCDDGSRHGTWVHAACERLTPGRAVELELVENEFRIGRLTLKVEVRDAPDDATFEESPEIRHAVGTVALRLLQQMAAARAPSAPPLTTVEEVTAFVGRIDAVLDVLIESVVGPGRRGSERDASAVGG